MNNDKKTQYVTRESIQKLLSAEEIACVSNAETATKLSDGDEYIDLEQLDRGVQMAKGKTHGIGRVLPKKQVHKDTWSKIVIQLSHAGSSSHPAA